MKAYQQLQKYLLENYPTIWHSKIVFLLIAGLFGWVVSFLAGYAISTEILTKFNIASYYFSSSFVFYHLIFLLIVLSIWALSFYKNNAVKAFYPVGNFYLLKLFTLLFIGIIFLVGIYFPYTYGIFVKTKQLLPKAVLENEIKNAKTAQAFLAIDASNYSIENKIYPPVFKSVGIAHYYYDSENERYYWESNVYPYIQYTPSYKEHYDEDEKYKERGVNSAVAATVAATAVAAVEGDENQQITDSIARLNQLFFDSVYQTGVGIEIDSVKYLFFNTDYETDKTDSCNSKSIITSFVKVSDSLLHIYSLANYSNTEYEFQQLNEYSEDSLAKLLYEITRTKNKVFVEKTLSNFVATLNKYQIENRIYPTHIANFLHAKNYINIPSITQAYFTPQYYNNYAACKKQLENAEANYSSLSAKQFQQYESILTDSLDMYFEKNDFRILTENYVVAHTTFFEEASFIATVIVCAIIVAFFLLLHVTNLKSFIIAIPVSGILFFVVVIFIAVFKINSDTEILSIGSFVSILLLLFSIYAIFSKKISKKITDIAFNIGATVSVYLLGLLYATGSILSKTEVYECGYSYKYLYEVNPWAIVGLSLVGFLSYLFLVKKWRAKAE